MSSRPFSRRTVSRGHHSTQTCVPSIQKKGWSWCQRVRLGVPASLTHRVSAQKFARRDVIRRAATAAAGPLRMNSRYSAISCAMQMSERKNPDSPSSVCTVCRGVGASRLRATPRRSSSIQSGSTRPRRHTTPSSRKRATDSGGIAARGSRFMDACSSLPPAPPVGAQDAPDPLLVAGTAPGVPATFSTRAGFGRFRCGRATRVRPAKRSLRRGAGGVNRPAARAPAHPPARGPVRRRR